MKINLAKSAGFCFGVKRALDITFKTASAEKKVYILGDIVHNEDVARQLARVGVKKVKELSPGKGRVFLIRAHGVERDIIRRAKKLGHKIIDATCPMVKEIQRISQEAERQGYQVIVIGDKRHDEVQGIIGQLRYGSTVLDASGGIPWKRLRKIKKACVVVQSTQNLDKVLKLTRALKPHFAEFKFFNTICMPTRIKQAEIKKMPLENDVMLIIGSRSSANTKRLYEISKSLNKRSYWIRSKEDIKPRWFKRAKSAGITAGASTPDATTREVVAYIKQILP